MKKIEKRQKRFTKMLVLVHDLERSYGSMMYVPDTNQKLKKLRKLANSGEGSEALNKFRYRVDNWRGTSVYFARIRDVNPVIFGSRGQVSFKDIRKKLKKKNIYIYADRKTALKSGDLYVKKGSVCIKRVQPVGKVA